MWSGGDPTSSATDAPAPPDISGLADLLGGQQQNNSAEIAALRDQIDADSAALRAAYDEAEAAGSDENYARRTAANAVEQAQSRKQALEAAERDRDSYQRQIEDMKLQLGVVSQRVSAMWDLARFYKDEYARNLANSIQKAALEVYCEARNAAGDILLAWHASCVRFGAAVAGVDSRLSTALAKHEYLKLDAPPTDQSPARFAEAQAQQADIDAQGRQIAEKEKDTYSEDKVREAEEKLAQAEAERDEAKEDEAQKAAREESLRAAYEKAQAGLNDAKARLAAIEGERTRSRRRT